jgi:drug/metabolite transporter (DMT)-like permease
MVKTVQWRRGFLFVLSAIILWGTVFVSSQIGLEYANPYNLVFFRLLVASFAVLALIYPLHIGREIIAALKYKITWLVGAIYALGFLFQYLGQALGTASEATLLTNLAPILIPLVAYALLKDRINRYQVLAMAIGLVGLILIASPNLGIEAYQVIGYILMFGSSLGYALFTVMSKKHNTVLLAHSFAFILIITIFLTPVALLLGGLNLSSFLMGPAGWLSVVWLAIPCSVLAITFYLRGLEVITASEAGFLQFLIIVIGLVLAAIFLGDFLSPIQILGAIIILGAMILASLKRPQQGRI